jgi:hypothetical protein
MMTLKEQGAETQERVEEAPDRAVMGASLLKQLAEEEAVVVILTEASQVMVPAAAVVVAMASPAPAAVAVVTATQEGLAALLETPLPLPVVVAQEETMSLVVPAAMRIRTEAAPISALKHQQLTKQDKEGDPNPPEAPV